MEGEWWKENGGRSRRDGEGREKGRKMEGVWKESGRIMESNTKRTKKSEEE